MLLDSTRRYLLQTKNDLELFIPHSRPAVEIPAVLGDEWVDPSIPLADPPSGSITFPTYVDSTMLSAYRSCPRRFFYEFCRNLHAKRKNVHFNAGGAYASAMEIARRAFYEQHLPSDLAIEMGFLALTTAYGDYVPPEGEYKAWERTAAAYLSYFQEVS